MRFFHVNKDNLLKISLSALLLLWGPNHILATSVDTLFRSEDVIRMELRSDFSAIQKDRNGDPEFHQGELICYSPAGKPVTLSVKVSVRGHFRLKPENCSFPPLLLDFKKNEVKNTIFENQDRLKLVTPCQTEEDLIDEYTAYKMYNHVTDLSFRVRLVKIRYIDTGRDKELFEKYSFFIEDKDHVAKRNNLIAKDRILTPFDLNRDNYIKLSLFQYLIGNEDWWISSRKNIVVMQTKDSTPELFAVPYDFDFSGLVDAEYTKPWGTPDYPPDERRVYKGICFTDQEFNEVFDFYRNLKPVFESIINNEHLISRYDRRQITGFINDFYKVIDNKYLIKQNILNVSETRKDYNLNN